MAVNRWPIERRHAFTFPVFVFSNLQIKGGLSFYFIVKMIANLSVNTDKQLSFMLSCIITCLTPDISQVR